MAKKSKEKKEKTKMEESAGDIIDLIKRDHKPIKKLLKIMKDDDSSLTEKRAAFAKFAPILVAHAKPEAAVWYGHMKSERDMKVEGLEGDVEHGLADQLIAELKRTKDKDMFEAKVKVLAELVEHHVKEEEDEMLPDFKKKSEREEREVLGAKYEKLRAAYR